MISDSEAISYEFATGPDLYALCQEAAKKRDNAWGNNLRTP